MLLQLSLSIIGTLLLSYGHEWHGERERFYAGQPLPSTRQEMRNTKTLELVSSKITDRDWNRLRGDFPYLGPDGGATPRSPLID